MRRTLAAVLLLTLAAAACSSNAPQANTAASTKPSTSTSAAPASAAASPSPSPTNTGKTLGTEQTFVDSSDAVTVKVTATSYQVTTLTNENQELAKAGTKVALVGVRMCIVADKSGQGVGLTWSPWSVLTAAGAAYTPPTAYGTQDWPGPLYPNDASLTYHAGTCRSGLIPFMFTGTDQPVTVEYNARGGVYDWRIG